MKGELKDYTVGLDGVLRYQDRIVLPQNPDLKNDVLKDAHCSVYAVHPGNNKMYQDLK